MLGSVWAPVCLGQEHCGGIPRGIQRKTLAVDVFAMLDRLAKDSFRIDKAKLYAPITRDTKRILSFKRRTQFFRMETSIVRVVLQHTQKCRELPLLRAWQLCRLFLKTGAVYDPHAFLKVLR